MGRREPGPYGKFVTAAAAFTRAHQVAQSATLAARKHKGQQGFEVSATKAREQEAKACRELVEAAAAVGDAFARRVAQQPPLEQKIEVPHG